MAKDPAFLFYPGNYLRDTQCLSEKAQVAYDRIMCEHMRNICEDMSKIVVSQERVDFFIKRLSDDERSELFHVLIKCNDGYQIDWVSESISKRKSYTNSRAANRSSKNKKEILSYDEHMENKNEIINTTVKLTENGKSKKPFVNYKTQGHDLYSSRLREHADQKNKSGT